MVTKVTWEIIIFTILRSTVSRHPQDPLIYVDLYLESEIIIFMILRSTASTQGTHMTLLSSSAPTVHYQQSFMVKIFNFDFDFLCFGLSYISLWSPNNNILRTKTMSSFNFRHIFSHRLTPSMRFLVGTSCWRWVFFEMGEHLDIWPKVNWINVIQISHQTLHFRRPWVKGSLAKWCRPQSITSGGNQVKNTNKGF